MTVAPSALVALAAVTILGAVIATSARGARSAILGLAVALLASGFLADPLPDLRALGARVVGGALAAYPLLVVIRAGTGRTAGSRLGWPAEGLFAAAVAVAGYAAGTVVAEAARAAVAVVGTGDATAGFGPVPMALGAGLALLGLAAEPVILSRDATRLAIGLVLAVDGAALVWTGLLGTAGAATSLVIVALIAAVAAVGTTIIRGARTAAEPAGERGAMRR